MDSSYFFVRKLQSIYRGYICRKKFIRILKSVIIIQYQFRKRRKRRIKTEAYADSTAQIRSSISRTSSIDDIKNRLKNRLVQVRQNNSQSKEHLINIRSVIKKRFPNNNITSLKPPDDRNIPM